jgi:hypothetical protein
MVLAYDRYGQKLPQTGERLGRGWCQVLKFEFVWNILGIIFNIQDLTPLGFIQYSRPDTTTNSGICPFKGSRF